MKFRGDALARGLTGVMLGGTTLIAVIAIIVLPGPAFIVIPAGIAILVIAYAWTRWWLRTLRKED
ncbi:MAG: PGPGW domain-containing protein [Gammaproteobacteria bacterium]